jgi:hypothetical protein
MRSPDPNALEAGELVVCENGHVVGRAIRPLNTGDRLWHNAFSWEQEDRPRLGETRHPECGICGAIFIRVHNGIWQLYIRGRGWLPEHIPTPWGTQ